MARVYSLFVSKIYQTRLAGAGARRLNGDLEAVCRSVAVEDRAGRAWCRAHGYRGYTSYASLDDLPVRAPAIAELVVRLDRHVALFARQLDLDLGGRRLELDSLWINVLEAGGFHTAHIHPNSVISGTHYVRVPKGASAIRFEDPRLAMMMAAPPRMGRSRLDNRTFAAFAPKAGTLLLWESWLRHEVPLNRAKGERISISFNYRLA